MDTPNTGPTSAMDASRTITAQRVEDSGRLAALPRHFGEAMMLFERTVFDFMHRFSPDYRGGFWQFYTLSNGGFYMALDRGSYRFFVESNAYEGVLSADAAGITVCLFACSHLALRDDRGRELFAERFHQLREYAIEHAEAAQIFAAID